MADEKRHCRDAHAPTTRSPVLHGGSQAVAHLQARSRRCAAADLVPTTWQRACDTGWAARSVSARNQGTENRRVYCDHCQTTVVEGAKFCPSCGGKVTAGPAADALDPSQAPTVVLTIGPCESCGAPSLPGSTLCLPCTRAFESILNSQPTQPMPAPVVIASAPLEATVAPGPIVADAVTLLQPQAPVLPSAPGGSAAPEAATILVSATDAKHDEPLGDDEEYEDEEVEAHALMAEESATPLATRSAHPADTPAVMATDSMDW